MDELEDIKKRKLRELLLKQQESIQQQAQDEAQLQAQIEHLESVVKQFFDKEALVRYGNLKTAHPEKAIQLLVILAQAIQQGQIKQVISSGQLKNLLLRLTPEKKDIKIKRVKNGTI